MIKESIRLTNALSDFDTSASGIVNHWNTNVVNKVKKINSSVDKEDNGRFLYDYIIGTSKDLYKKANDWKGRLNSIKTSVDGDINVKIRQLKIAEQAERFENANLKG